MAESAPGSRGSDHAGPGTGLPSPVGGPGTASPHSPHTSHPRDAAGEESDSDTETPTSSVTCSEEEEEEEEGHQWKVGDACSAIWRGDGLLYPAHLRALDPNAGTCLVEFDGYGNTEEQVLADLLPPRPGSWGVKGTLRGEGGPLAWEPLPGVRRKGQQAPCSPQPLKAMPTTPLRTVWEEEEEQEALTAMLMSWYMSGYHTGFYMGLREGRAEAAEPPPRPGHQQKKAQRS
ncbi:survival motor neuron protein 1-like [Cuculus canorus]|uniref:survival motor neuron protein 1-like n=1 Tax=Cuculus canorus TaxID=55661 RepID=UPI0023AB40A0|nr:survival motor neuron protein 1-like [Cuculus canorus]